MLHDCTDWCRSKNVNSVYFETEDWRGVIWDGNNCSDIRIHNIQCAERVNCVAKCLVNICTGGSVMFLKKEDAGLRCNTGRTNNDLTRELVWGTAESDADQQATEMKQVFWLICNLCRKDAILSIEDIVQWCYGVTNMHKSLPLQTPKPPLPTWINVALPSELATRPKLLLPRKARPKDVDLASLDPTLAARFPTVGVTIGASPTAIALALTRQPRQQMHSSKRASDSIALTTSKKAKRISDANPEEGAQLAHVGLHDAIKALAKDSELLKAAKAAHSKEVKGLKTVMAKKLAEDLKSTEEDALKEFKKYEAFHEEAMAHADLHARTVVDKWIAGSVGNSERSPGPISPDDANANASVYIAGDEISIDNAYLNSSANLDFVAGMDHAPVLTLAEDDQGDAVATEEEHPLLPFN
nr:uncharacterized protein LOC109147873 [Ipomoea batatas]